METATGSCPLSAVYVQSIFSFGHFAALMSDMLSNTYPEIPPTKYRYVIISPFNILILVIILNMYCFIWLTGFEQFTKKAERLVNGSDSNLTIWHNFSQLLYDLVNVILSFYFKRQNTK